MNSLLRFLWCGFIDIDYLTTYFSDSSLFNNCNQYIFFKNKPGFCFIAIIFTQPKELDMNTQSPRLFLVEATSLTSFYSLT